jgi:outer membrane protein OmpA-like peptidoglycan-associated protein
LTEGYEYSFFAKNKNYISSRYNRDYSNIDAYEEIELDLFLTPIELDATVILNNVFFAPNKAVLLDKSKPELDRVVKLLKDNSSIEVEIGGHTNPSRATEQYHRDLSESRAVLIRDYLVGEGISSSRITAKGYGYNFPVERGLSANNKMKNMRVEFKIVKF